jgi:hypothetical protein
MKTLRALTAVAGLLAAAAAFAVAKLDVGVKAPDLKVAKWVKGKEIKSFKKGNVYVVEFWATWCGPCKQSIPHLTELAAKYKGKVDFTGVSVWERQENPTDSSYFAKVDEFVKTMGPKMNYNVAVDGTDKFMAKNWMQAAGENGIPAAFIIDQEGDVAWIGHPMGDLDSTLQKVLDKKWDKNAFAQARTAEKENEAKLQQSFKDLQLAVRGKDWDAAIAKGNEIKKINAEYASTVDVSIVMGALAVDEAAGQKMAREYSNGSLAKDPMALNQIAWFIVDDASKMKSPDFALAADLARKAVEAGGDKMPEVLDTYAVALSKNGQLDEAIAASEKAVALVNAAGSKYPDQMKKEISDRLASLKAKKKA